MSRRNSIDSGVSISVLLTLLVIFPFEALAAPPHKQSSSILPVVTRTHNVGLLTLRVSNGGFFGAGGDGRNARWQGYEHLYLSGLWVGAVGADQATHVSAVESFEFHPEPGPEWTIYASYEGQPRGNRAGLLGLQAADDDEDGLIDEDFQNGLDDDGDGRIDEDFQAIGQQMYSSMYRDNASSDPLGLLIRQRSFQWSTAEINELVGFEFDVINDGEADLHDVYLGLYCDADVGPATVSSYPTDDLAGWDQIDTTLFSSGPGNPDPCYTSMAIDAKTMFMWDAPDDGSTATGGDAPGVFGTVLTGHTTDVLGVRAPQRVDWRTATWVSLPNFLEDGDRYTLLSGGMRPLTNPRSGVAKGSTVDPGDYATLISVGPFPLMHPGESVTVDAAHVVGDRFTGYRLNVVKAQRLAATQYLDMDNDPQTGIAGKERCLRALVEGEPVIWNNPCDTMALGVEWSSTECLWVDLDCSPCTGIYGAETLVPWVGLTLPPYPNSNLDLAYVAGLPPEQEALVVNPAGDGRVILQWDNLGELWTDPITGVKSFWGYQIWKVSDWTEPGVPDPEDWVQIAEFINGDPGPYLDDVLNRDVDPIGIAPDGTPIYPVGRYAFVDSTVTNGHAYFYCVTTLSRIYTYQGVQEFAALPWTTEERAVVPCDLCEAVPVRLLSFTAERVGTTARLSWTIADPQNLAGFQVAREIAGTPGRTRISERLISGGTDFMYVDEHPPAEAIQYWLQEERRDGSMAWLGHAEVDARIGPSVFSVRSPAPNPFTTATHIGYQLPDSRHVRASIHDLSGRRIRVLLDQEQPSGTFTLHWSGDTDAGRRAAPGLYIFTLEAGRDRMSRELLLLR